MVSMEQNGSSAGTKTDNFQLNMILGSSLFSKAFKIYESYEHFNLILSYCMIHIQFKRLLKECKTN